MRLFFTIIMFLGLFIPNVVLVRSSNFDQRIRERFPNVDIPTDRRFDIENTTFEPNKIKNVYVFKKFVFFTFEEDGVQISDEINRKFVKAFEHAANIFDECVDIPYSVPVIVLYGKDKENCTASSMTAENVVDTSGDKAVSKILRGDNDAYIQIWINSNVDQVFISDIQEDGYYYFQKGEPTNYLPVVIAHEIFHGLAQNYPLLRNNMKSYGTPCEEEGTTYPKKHHHFNGDYCSADLFYIGKNAVMANGGFPIQTENMHFRLFSNLKETIASGGLVDLDRFYIWNHVGPVSLGLLQDVGYKVKQSYLDIECYQEGYGKPTWDIIDLKGNHYGSLTLGKLNLFPECKEKYLQGDLLEMALIKPYLDNYYNPTGIESINDKQLNVYSKNGFIYITGISGKINVLVHDIGGRLVAQKEIKGDTSILIAKAGIYLVKIDNQVYKIRCK